MGKPKRILVTAHHWFHEVIGGSFRLATEFAEYLASQGHHVDYLASQGSQVSQKPGHPHAELGLEGEYHFGVRVFRIPFPHQVNRLARVRYFKQSTAALARKLHRENPYDAISAHSPLQAAAVFGVLSDASVRKNYTVHSPFDDELRSHQNWKTSVVGLVHQWLARRIECKCIRCAHVVQTMSHYTLQSLNAKYPGVIGTRGVVAPGWVDLDAFRPVSDRMAARQELGEHWKGGCPLFLTVRRLEPRMGLDTLIRAVALLQQDVPEFHVLIGGSGSQREALEGLSRSLKVEHRVRFLGRVPEADLSASYAAADCFVLPTKALECFGLIVLEAFAANTPVIASRAAAIPEIAAQQGEDWMFDPGNEHQLAERMRSFLLGDLKTCVDLRAIAQRYDRREVLKVWESLI